VTIQHESLPGVNYGRRGGFRFAPKFWITDAGRFACKILMFRRLDYLAHRLI
jgi:hypothetical protein